MILPFSTTFKANTVRAMAAIRIFVFSEMVLGKSSTSEKLKNDNRAL